MISEYGRRPTAEEVRRLFPFFGLIAAVSVVERAHSLLPEG
jgi:hypothetical protein